MDLNEILTKERDSLRDENIELKKNMEKMQMEINKVKTMGIRETLKSLVVKKIYNLSEKG